MTKIILDRHLKFIFKDLEAKKVLFKNLITKWTKNLEAKTVLFKNFDVHFLKIQRLKK